MTGGMARPRLCGFDRDEFISGASVAAIYCGWGHFERRSADMRSFSVLATAVALIMTGTAGVDAAPRKKVQGSDRAAATAKQKPGQVSKPAARRSNQGWPTSVNDGSFSYGFGPGGSMR
jgi:hypothetical protein